MRGVTREAGCAAGERVNKKAPAQRTPLLRARPLAKNVFYFLEEGRIAFGRAIFHLEYLVQLLQQQALVTRKFARRNHSHVHVQIAFASSMRIRQSLTLQPNDGTRLGSLGNGNFLLAIETGYAEVGAQRGLRNADGHCAVKVRATALKKRMFLHIQNDVEIAGRRSIGSGFALVGYANARLRIDARGNAHFDCSRPLDPAAASAFRAFFANHLTGALALGAGARDGKKTLLIMQLSAPFAGLAGHHTGAGFRPGSLASLAQLLSRQTNLGADARGRLLKRQLHVIPQIGAALHALTAAAAGASENVLESKKVAEDILKFVEDRGVEARVGGNAGNAGMAVAIVCGTFLGIGEDAVGFRGFAKLRFGSVLLLRIAIGMPLERSLAVGGLDLVLHSRTAHAQHFVIITLGLTGHASISVSWEIR